MNKINVSDQDVNSVLIFYGINSTPRNLTPLFFFCDFPRHESYIVTTFVFFSFPEPVSTLLSRHVHVAVDCIHLFSVYSLISASIYTVLCVVIYFLFYFFFYKTLFCLFTQTFLLQVFFFNFISLFRDLLLLSWSSNTRLRTCTR